MNGTSPGPALALLNTKPVGYIGIALIAAGLVGPPALGLVVHDRDLLESLAMLGRLLVAVGGGGAYFGRPQTVLSNAPANTP
ncbi:MAG: hypothetical protein NVSMB64_30830 [Candidatus Velthaea sp.]